MALVSRSGGGKSSIFKLLYGYNAPFSGKIYIDGQDISQISLKSLQAAIGPIAQQSNLFAGTIRDNIKFGAPNPDLVNDEQIFDLAESLNLLIFLKSFKEGLDTQVGERGGQLSGGEQQRVAIIRGFLKSSAKIWMLDEITSALDRITGEQVMSAIMHNLENKTTLFITHNPQEAQLAKTILVIGESRVLDHGSHAELMQRPGLYQDLWNEQNKKLGDKVNEAQEGKDQLMHPADNSLHKKELPSAALLAKSRSSVLGTASRTDKSKEKLPTAGVQAPKK